MTARVLVVDDIATNVKLLEARLTAEYYDVLTAYSGREALEVCANNDVDIILLDVMMPEMDGFEVCRAIKSNPLTHHIPVVMVTALDQPSDRVKGLEAGADDFLTKPPDDMQLLARVKSLVRLKILTDELRARARTSQQIAAEDIGSLLGTISIEHGSILLVDDNQRSAARIASFLTPRHDVHIISDPTSVGLKVADAGFEVALICMELKDFDPLRVVSQLRTLEQTRSLPIILIAEETDRPRVVRGLDLGVNDFIMRPIEKNELMARVHTQLRRHRYAMELRESVNLTMAMAVLDELTGLYNRRYFDRHMSLMLKKAQSQGRELALVMLDIDFFKSVNDTFGHGVGDQILKEFSLRLQRNIRGVDLACRYGGEEFVVLMPDTNQAQAQDVAERVRQAVADKEFGVSPDRSVDITVSVGVAMNELDDETPETMLKRADMALYRAKHQGRNRVVFDAA
ncbi:Pole remodelling regulatory diguanylate cyclase [hydrothermal vent metagenome]|uniref:Pole remodelling regulatory diguanylate cyclase n=1 Tax=hydrothermal vent metagenome TaxID=652676 RepID=A0A3B0TX41_9ZZZZ